MHQRHSDMGHGSERFGRDNYGHNYDRGQAGRHGSENLRGDPRGGRRGHGWDERDDSSRGRDMEGSDFGQGDADYGPTGGYGQGRSSGRSEGESSFGGRYESERDTTGGARPRSRSDYGFDVEGPYEGGSRRGGGGDSRGSESTYEMRSYRGDSGGDRSRGGAGARGSYDERESGQWRESGMGSSGREASSHRGSGGSSYGPDREGSTYGGFRSGSGGSGDRMGSRGQERSSDSYGRGSFAGRGPKGYRRSDERIQEDVSECLKDHGDIDASEIEVAVSNGIVTLSGTVSDRNAKRLAEQCIEHISGVDDVTNQIRVTSSQKQEEDGSRTASAGSSSSKESGQSGQQQRKQAAGGASQAGSGSTPRS